LDFSQKTWLSASFSGLSAKKSWLSASFSGFQPENLADKTGRKSWLPAKFLLGISQFVRTILNAFLT
jgi:hypothetical protein